MHHRLLSYAVAWAALLGTVTSRPYLDDVLIDVDELSSPANVAIETESLGSVQLLRRQNEGGGSSMCRGLCGYGQSGLGMMIEEDTSGGDTGLEARGLWKRYLRAPPTDFKQINNYVKDAVEHLTINILREEDFGGTSSGFYEFGTPKASVGARALCGCTVLTVVSKEAVYMAHFFEDLSFDVRAGRPGTTKQETAAIQAKFHKNVIKFLNKVTGPTNTNFRNLGLKGVKSRLQTGVRAFIMTPQREFDDAVEQGQATDDKTVTYVAGLNYENQIMMLKAEVERILGPDVPVTLIQYQAINGEDPEARKALWNSAKGRIIFEYGGTQEGRSGQDRARLWMETNIVWSWTYQSEPGAHTTLSSHVPVERGIGVGVRQESLDPSTATSQQEQTTTELPWITKVVIGQTTLTLSPTPRVVTVSGNPVTLQSDVVVMANRTMSLRPTQNEVVLTNQGIVLTLERDAGTGLASATNDVSTTSRTTAEETTALMPSGFSSVTASSTGTEDSTTAALSTETPSITNANPFPSTVFSLPPIVTTTSTSMSADGRNVVVTVTGTTDSAGVVVPVSTLQSAEASRSASALASQLSAVSSAVSAFSADPADSAKATAAVSAIHDAQSSNNEFGRDLGIAATGLCFLFCSTVAGVAGALGSLEVGVSGVIAGTASVGPLGGLAGAVGDAAAAISDKASNNQASEITFKRTTKSDRASSTCEPTTITDFQVKCATGVANDGASTTSCSTVSTIVVTSCSATATTATTYQTGFCPLSRESSGPIATYSYPGYQDLPITTTIFLSGTVTVNVTTSSTIMPTGTGFTSDIPTTTTTLNTTELSRTEGTSTLTPATSMTTTESTSTTSVKPACPSATQACVDCSGDVSNGNAACRGGDADGCACTPSIDTPGFSCGAQKSCELNNCDGSYSDGKATCQNAFKGCECLTSTNTPGFSCGAAKSCQSDGCNGSGSYLGGAYCQDAFKGCECTPDSSTPGFCGSLAQCSFSGCNGVAVSGEQFGVCQADSHKGCSCILGSQPTTLATEPSTAPQAGPSWVLRLWGDQSCKADSVPFLQQVGNGPSKCVETDGQLRSWCAPKDTWPSSLKVLFYDSEGCQGNPLASLTSSNKGCAGEIQAFVGCYEDDNLKSFQVVSA